MFMVKTVGVITIFSVVLGASAAVAQPAVPPVKRLMPPAPSVAARASAASESATSSGIGVASGEELLASTLSVYTPPACVPGVPFADITCTTGFDPWIEQFGLDGITSGCGGGNYCPGTPVTRNQMAVFIEKAMRGTGNWPPHTVLVYHHPEGESNSDVNSGTELASLVAAIPGSGYEAPSNANRWLIKLGPGTYDLGSGGLSVPAWVSLEGSGMEETFLVNTGDLIATVSTSGGVNTFTRLTMRNSGTGSYAYAVYANGSRIVLDRAEAFANGGSTVTVGVYADSTAVEMYNQSVADATGLGGTSLGIYTHGGQYSALTIQNSVVAASNYAIYNAAGYEVDMAYSGVYDSSLANFGPGVFKCIGNYDFNMNPVACP
jgi:hypothetical protein